MRIQILKYIAYSTILLLTAAGSFFATSHLLQRMEQRAANLPVRHFSGANFVTEKLRRLRPPYTIDFILQSKNAIGGTAYNTNSPPMPLLMLPVRVDHMKDKLMVTIDKTLAAAIPHADRWNRLTFEVDKSRRGLLFVNGHKVWQGRVASDPDQLTIGKGFKKRFWTGAVRRFRITEGASYIQDFDPKANVIFDNTRVLFDLKTD